MFRTTAENQEISLNEDKKYSDASVVLKAITFSNAFPLPSPIVLDEWRPDNSYTVELIHNGKSLARTPLIAHGIFNSTEVEFPGPNGDYATVSLRLYQSKYGSFEAAVQKSDSKPNLAFSMDNFRTRTGNRLRPGPAPTLAEGMANAEWVSYGLTDFSDATRQVRVIGVPANLIGNGSQTGRIRFSNLYPKPQPIEIDGWMPGSNYTVELIHKGKSLAKTSIKSDGIFDMIHTIGIEGADDSEEIFTLRLYMTIYGSFEKAVKASGIEPRLAFSLDDFPAWTGPARQTGSFPPGLGEGMTKSNWKSYYGLTDYSILNLEEPAIINRYLRFSNGFPNSHPIIIDGFVPSSRYKVELVHKGEVIATTPIEERGFFNGPVVAIPGGETPYRIVSLRLYHSRFPDWETAVQESADTNESAYLLENFKVFTKSNKINVQASMNALTQGMRETSWQKIPPEDMTDGDGRPVTPGSQTGGKLLFSNTNPGQTSPINIQGFIPGRLYRMELVHQGKILGVTDMNEFGFFTGGIIRIPGLDNTNQIVSLRIYLKKFRSFEEAVQNVHLTPRAAFTMDEVEVISSKSPHKTSYLYVTLQESMWEPYSHYDPFTTSSLSGGLLFSNREPFDFAIYVPGIDLENDYVIEMEHRGRLIARWPLLPDGFFASSVVKIPDNDAEAAEMNLHVYKKKFINVHEAMKASRPGKNMVYTLPNFMAIYDRAGRLAGIHPNIPRALQSKQGEWISTEINKLPVRKPEGGVTPTGIKGIVMMATYLLPMIIVLISIFLPYFR